MVAELKKIGFSESFYGDSLVSSFSNLLMLTYVIKTNELYLVNITEKEGTLLTNNPTLEAIKSLKESLSLIKQEKSRTV